LVSAPQPIDRRIPAIRVRAILVIRSRNLAEQTSASTLVRLLIAFDSATFDANVLPLLGRDRPAENSESPIPPLKGCSVSIR
jgi:hypothetical protein